jgi:integrase
LKKRQFEHLTVHGLRHSFATLMLSHNVPLKDVQEVLGHSRPSVTLDVYWQAVAGASGRVADHAEDILFSPGPEADVTDLSQAPPRDS